MKVRYGFVSNSSTSSFLCDVCGTIEADRDLNIKDAEMVSCRSGHTLCTSHMRNEDFDSKSLEEKRKLLLANDWLKESDNLEGAEIEDMYEDWKSDYGIPPAMCPFCQLNRVTDSHLISHLLKVLGSSREQVIEQIKEQYGTYENFAQAMKN